MPLFVGYLTIAYIKTSYVLCELSRCKEQNRIQTYLIIIVETNRNCKFGNLWAIIVDNLHINWMFPINCQDYLTLKTNLELSLVITSERENRPITRFFSKIKTLKLFWAL